MQPLLTVGLVFVVALPLSAAPPTTRATTRPTTQAATQSTTKPAIALGKDGKGAEREAFIRKAQNLGIFGKVHVQGGIGTVEVTETYMELDYKGKVKLAGAVFGWCEDHDPKMSVLKLNDIKTGKQVGTLTPKLGLKFD